MTYRCLCQDCLRVPLFPARPQIDDYSAADWVHCECGGELCDCPSCVATAVMLEQGERDYQVLGLQNQITGSTWTAAGGLADRPTAQGAGGLSE